MKLSILIHALNEEKLIANCLESALEEARKSDGEVILVDSLSTDKTVEIARNYPIRIIQFMNKADCSAASAVQAGYQYANGESEFLYVLDGDMVLQPGFISVAMSYLESNPDVAGVAGKVLDTSIKSWADRRRASIAKAQQQIVEVSELGGGGLYRRSAIESVDYLAHRWLRACEEAELGARLRAKGWRLIRLPEIAVIHTGYSESTSKMLRRLWRNRQMHAYGTYLRTAFRRPWWWLTVCQLWFLFATVILHVMAGILAVLGVMQLELINTITALIASEILIWSGVILVLAIRKKSITDAIISIYTWNCYSLAAVFGFSQSTPDPKIPICGQELTTNLIPK